MGEEWVEIAEFPRYQVSNLGRVIRSDDRKEMRLSETTYGDRKVSLTRSGQDRITRSVRVLVAESFVAKPSAICDTVVLLDGDRHNLAWDNMCWRPRWFAWAFLKQQEFIPPQYERAPILNSRTREWYPSVVDCGNKEGLLFDDVWRSANTGVKIFPTGGPYDFA